MIQADAMYTAAELRKLGIGSTMLGRARRAGVSVVRIGKPDWYYGRDLIAWMRNMDSATNGASDGKDSGHEAHFLESVSQG
jgi:hypothetical protein